MYQDLLMHNVLLNFLFWGVTFSLPLPLWFAYNKLPKVLHHRPTPPSSSHLVMVPASYNKHHIYTFPGTKGVFLRDVRQKEKN